MRSQSLFTWPIARRALTDAFIKLDPRWLLKNPVMFAVEVVTVLVSGQLVVDIVQGTGDVPFELQIAIWLWLTVLFGTLSEAIAEGRGKAQTDSLRASRQGVTAHRSLEDGSTVDVAGTDLKKGDLVVCEAGDTIPSDGEIIEGLASVDESTITGESAPVIRESGGDRSSVTGGTRVLSDRIVIRISAEPGQTFIDRMIRLVEGAVRQKTPNEIALNVLLVSLTIVFVLVTMALAARALDTWAGGPGRVREFGCKFTKPVVVPDDDTGVEIVVRGTVTGVDDGIRVALEVSCGDDKVLGAPKAVLVG